jgi:3-oxoacyl-[acyl-carrier-protein] synthase II
LQHESGLLAIGGFVVSERTGVRICGLGIVSPLGVGVDEVWKRLLAGERGLDDAPESSRQIPTPRYAATVDRFSSDLDQLVAHRSLRRVSQLSRYCVGASALAAPRSLGDSSEVAFPCADDTAVILGTCYGSSRYHFDYYEKLFSGGLREASPLLFSECVMNAASGHVALFHGVRGASLALVGGEEVGLTAIAEAADRLRLGDARAALAGGADEYCDFVHAALSSREFVGDEATVPFASSAAIPFLSEGAAILYLERDDVDGAGEPLARWLGWGMVRGRADTASAAVRGAVRRALDDANVSPADIDLVVVGASGAALDATELGSVASVIDEPGERDVVVACPNAAFGEGFAFTSGAQAIVAVKALSEGVVPPTPLAERPSSLPASWTIPGTPLARELRCALAVKVTRRGSAVAVVMGRA